MRSIGLKLWAGMMILVLLMIMLLWFFQIVFLERFYTSMRISEVKNKGYSIVKEMRFPIKEENRNDLEAFSYNNNLTIEIFDAKGGVIFETAAGSAGHMPMMFNNYRFDIFSEALMGREVSTTLKHHRFGNKFILIGLPIAPLQETEGVLLINMPLTPVEDTAVILKRQLLYITIFLLAAASIISFIISRNFTKPILQIKRTSEKMASGDFSDRLRISSKDEIGKLAETINNMGQELSKIEQLRKDFIANVSHELRTPLSLIRGYAETLRDVTGDIPEKREKQLGIIVEESERLSRIVDDILNLSQIQSGYIDFKFSTFSIKELIQKVVKRYEILEIKTGVKIKVINGCSSTVRGDEAAIEQVLYNLINNAFNYTPSGGSITIVQSEANTSIRVEVRDTGTGIAPEELKLIWDRYYKASKKSGSRVVGTGLGLAIVKGILEAHSALYGTHSIVNEGTTFWFELQKSGHI